MSRNDYIFGGTRLQARLGQRLSERDWQRLASIRDSQHLIDGLMQTGAADWIRGMDAGMPVDQVEKILLQRLGNFIETVAGWYPRQWRAAIVWTRTLPWLNTLRAVPTLSTTGRLVRLTHTPFETAEDLRDEARLNVLRDTEFAPLVATLASEEPLFVSWYRQWQRYWPPSAKTWQHPLVILVDRFIAAFDQITTGQADIPEATAGLVRHFHQYIFTPVGCFAFLGIQLIELIALRQLLLDRLLFAEEAAA